MAAGVVGGVLAGVALGAQGLLARQAAVARAAIGKPLGEEALRADRVFKSERGRTVELLLLGDSVAAGLGAERAKHTLGARLGRKLAARTGRAVRLSTAARVGAESSDLADQLDGLPQGYRPDVAVVVVGGNDVTHRVPVAESAADLARCVLRLREQECEVVVGTCPDLGALQAVPQPLRSLGSLASRRLAAAQAEAVRPLGARVVALATSVGPFFTVDPDAHFSADRFHPSSLGYKRTAQALLPALVDAVGRATREQVG